VNYSNRASLAPHKSRRSLTPSLGNGTAATGGQTPGARSAARLERCSSRNHRNAVLDKTTRNLRNAVLDETSDEKAKGGGGEKRRKKERERERTTKTREQIRRIKISRTTLLRSSAGTPLQG